MSLGRTSRWSPRPTPPGWRDTPPAGGERGRAKAKINDGEGARRGGARRGGARGEGAATESMTVKRTGKRTHTHIDGAEIVVEIAVEIEGAGMVKGVLQ